MRTDLIKRNLLSRELKRQEALVYDGEAYLRRDAVLEKVSMAPSVDAVAVERGRWECDMYFDQPVMRCTVCLSGFAEGHHAERFQFCPNCGARMNTKEATP